MYRHLQVTLLHRAGSASIPKHDRPPPFSIYPSLKLSIYDIEVVLDIVYNRYISLLPLSRLQLRLPSTLDLLLNLLLSHKPQILSQNFSTRTLGNSFNKYNPTSQPLVVGYFRRYPI